MTDKEKREKIKFIILIIVGILGAITFVLRFTGVIPQIKIILR